MADSLLALLRKGRGKFGRAQGCRGEPMPQFQAQVPHPLAHDTPGLLTASGVTTPPIRVELLILVSKLRLKGTAMQVQFDHIRSGEAPALAKR